MYLREEFASDAEIPKVFPMSFDFNKQTCRLRLAYDGRGNVVIRKPEHIETAIEALGGLDAQLYVEEWVSFRKELAVIVGRSETNRETRLLYVKFRSVSGEILSYPVTETIHRESICYLTETPASVTPKTLEAAKNLAEQAVGCLEGAGVYGFG